MAPSSKYNYYIKASAAVADATLLFCGVGLIALVLITSSASTDEELAVVVRGRQMAERPCDEIYVVGEGETLNTISEKCGDPYIVERNPHIHDPDDVFPGLVIKIAPLLTSRNHVSAAGK
ncbi:hypothetical protein ABFS83_06G113100 [Erythranthe nasuta]